MNNFIFIVVILAVLAISFLTSYFISFKLAQNKKWMPNLWIVGFIIGFICLAMTVIFAFLVSFQIMMIISAFSWGVGLGNMSGLLNYKFSSKQHQRGL